MSPITVRAELDSNSDISEPHDVASNGFKKEQNTSFEENSLDEEPKTHINTHGKKGSLKFDAGLQAYPENENSSGGSHRGVNHRPPAYAEDDHHGGKRDSRRNNSRNSNGRASEESVRSTGRRSGDGGSRRSFESTSNRKSSDSQRSVSSTEKVSCEDSSDQLSQITDILLARLITTLSDSTLGNPALLLQTLLGFSPDDYSDLLAALSESHLSYVDIISAYLHNIRVMSEDSGSTSAALSGTLTRSLIEQYNSLLAQAVKSPQSIARATLISDTEGRSSHLADLLQKANSSNSSETRNDRRSFENLLPKGPSGLGFGRRHSTDSTKQRQNFLQNTSNESLTSKPNGQTENGLLDLTKFFNVPKIPNTELTSGLGGGTAPTTTAANCSNGTAGTTATTTVGGVVPSLGLSGAAAAAAAAAAAGNFVGMSPEQLTALLHNSGMLTTGTSSGSSQYLGGPPSTTTLSQSNVPSLPFLPNPVNPISLNGMVNPYGLPQMQAWSSPTVPIPQMPMNNRNMWQGASNGNASYGSFRGGWGTGLETVHENFNSPGAVSPSTLQLYQDQQSCFPTAINMQQPSQQ